MTSKERVQTALNHEIPDRVPTDLGGRQTTLSIVAYKNLKSYLGLPESSINIMSKIWQSAFIDEEILEHLYIDCRHVRPKDYNSEKTELSQTDTEGYEIFTDQWGIKRKIVDDYANIISHPLKGCSIAMLDDFPWPDPEHDYDFSNLKSHTKKLFEENRYAIVGCMGSPGNIFEQSWYLRDFQELLMDLASDHEFIHALFRKIINIRKRNAELFLNEVGEYIDVFQLADDLSMQTAPFVSPKMYREMIKPYHTELISFVKGFTKAKIYFHSCGAVSPLLDDLIDAGVEILNPVQVSASKMETDVLKRRYGNKLSFWGAIDTFKVLPNGSPKDVENEVRKRIGDLAPSGGYVIGPVHNIQSDIPPQNIIALYESARKYGDYPEYLY